MSKYKHLSLSQRQDIETGLTMGMTFKAIAHKINKDPSTVSKEVKKHLLMKPSNVKNYKDGSQIASSCPKLLRPPFVCNGCDKACRACPFTKQFYRAKRAHNEYKLLLTDAREGIPLNKESFYEIDKVISQGVKKGQHIFHIVHANQLDIGVSTVYRHINKGYLSIAKLDLPRAVKFKPRKQRKADYVPKAAKLNRSYEDFKAFLEANQLIQWLEMDTVIGRVGGKVIATFNVSPFNFMFALLLDDKTALTFASALQGLKQQLSQNQVTFSQLFPVLLADNGGEFAYVSQIEADVQPDLSSHLFFCDPNSPSQKARIEKNHTLLRDILPKGTSFDALTQEQLNLIMSHINAVHRKGLNGKSAYDLFAFTFGESIATLLGVNKIEAEDVIQSPALLKQFK